MPPIPPPAISTGRGEEVCEVVGAPDMPRLSMQRRLELVTDAAGEWGGWRMADGLVLPAAPVQPDLSGADIYTCCSEQRAAPYCNRWVVPLDECYRSVAAVRKWLLPICPLSLSQPTPAVLSAKRWATNTVKQRRIRLATSLGASQSGNVRCRTEVQADTG